MLYLYVCISVFSINSEKLSLIQIIWSVNVVKMIKWTNMNRFKLKLLWKASIKKINFS